MPDDHLGGLHSREMLNGSGDAAGDVESGADGFPGLAHLQGMRRVAGVHGRPGGPDRRPEKGCALPQDLEIFRRSQGATAGNDDLGLGDVRSPGIAPADPADHHSFREGIRDLVFDDLPRPGIDAFGNGIRSNPQNPGPSVQPKIGRRPAGEVGFPDHSLGKIDMKTIQDQRRPFERCDPGQQIPSGLAGRPEEGIELEMIDGGNQRRGLPLRKGGDLRLRRLDRHDLVRAVLLQRPRDSPRRLDPEEGRTPPLPDPASPPSGRPGSSS